MRGLAVDFVCYFSNSFGLPCVLTLEDCSKVNPHSDMRSGTLQRSSSAVVVIAAAACLIIPLASLAAEEEENAVKAQPMLSLSLSVGEPDFKAGDEVGIIFTIKNDGDRAYSYYDRNYDRSGRMPEYQLAAVDGAGKTVPDPRDPNSIYVGGGLQRQAELAPGESFTKTIALNRWALLKTPGTFQVTGTYAFNDGAPQGESWLIDSAAIKIEIGPRSDEELGKYIEELATQLAEAEDGQDRAALVRKLMYTIDGRAAPALIEAFYRKDNANFWVGEAFNY